MSIVSPSAAATAALMLTA